VQGLAITVLMRRLTPIVQYEHEPASTVKNNALAAPICTTEAAVRRQDSSKMCCHRIGILAASRSRQYLLRAAPDCGT
jgi:hypothetical protein